MSKKTVLSIIGLACLVVGIYCAIAGTMSKPIAYALAAVGSLLFFGPILGVRRVVAFLVIIAVTFLAYYLVVYLLGVFGIVLQSKGRTTIFLISLLFVYIFSSFFVKRS